MPDLLDGQSVEVKGSAALPYVLKNVGGVYSCTCPAWRNQGGPPERRTCKHLRKLRGDAAEEARLGGALPAKPVKPAKPAGEGAEGGDGDEAAGPPILLAESWDNSADLAGWWMSEKLDGVRAYWDGTQFISRLGNLYHAPDWFVAGLPQMALDGELWMGRKQFQKLVGAVKRQDKSDLWKTVKYLVFDAPSAEGGFEERVAAIKDALGGGKAEYAQAHEHWLCKGVDHLRAELARVESLGGEGLMLRQPSSMYHAGRSSTLLKVKTFHDDEAVVIGHLAGTGKHKGRLGALRVKLKSGVEFSVGTGFSDREREAPPTAGTTITFRYQELSDGGVPRFPSYVGVRSDSAKAAAGTGDGSAKAAAPIAVASATRVETPNATPSITPTPAPAPKAAAPTPAASSPAPTAGATASRRFEFVEGASAKFWEVSQSGADMTTRWGRLGSAGQSKTKSFANEAAAAKQVAKLIEEKTSEGYVEVG